MIIVCRVCLSLLSLCALDRSLDLPRPTHRTSHTHTHAHVVDHAAWEKKQKKAKAAAVAEEVSVSSYLRAYMCVDVSC